MGKWAEMRQIFHRWFAIFCRALVARSRAACGPSFAHAIVIASTILVSTGPPALSVFDCCTAWPRFTWGLFKFANLLDDSSYMCDLRWNLSFGSRLRSCGTCSHDASMLCGTNNGVLRHERPSLAARAPFFSHLVRPPRCASYRLKCNMLSYKYHESCRWSSIQFKTKYYQPFSGSCKLCLCLHCSGVTKMKLSVIFVVGLLAYLAVASVCEAAVDEETSDRSPESLDDSGTSDRPIGANNNQEPKRNRGTT